MQAARLPDPCSLPRWTWCVTGRRKSCLTRTAQILTRWVMLGLAEHDVVVCDVPQPGPPPPAPASRACLGARPG